MSDHVCVRSMMRLIAGSSAVSVRIASPFTIFASVWLSIMMFFGSTVRQHVVGNFINKLYSRKISYEKNKN